MKDRSDGKHKKDTGQCACKHTALCLLCLGKGKRKEIILWNG